MKFQAYYTRSIYHMQLQDTAEELLEDNLITPSQLEAVKTTFPINFKQPNIFIRIGAFLFTSLFIIFSLVLIGWFMGDFMDKGFGGFLLFWGVVLVFLNEFLIKNNNWYRHGSDNALCYASLTCLIGGICFILKFDSLESIAFVSLLFISLAIWRYGDPLLVLGAFYAFFIFIVETFMYYKTGLVALPFTLAILFFALYIFAKSGLRRSDWYYWRDCFRVMEVLSLVGLYSALNYYVNHQIAISINYENTEKPLPMGLFFAVLTAIVPLSYLIIGIKKRDRILWILGGLGIITSILTYRYYNELMPLEWALTLAGLALIGISVFLIKYLKTPQNGFAFRPEKSKTNPLEAIIFNEIIQHNNTQTDTNNQFGGGDFGGGGASDNY